MKQGEDHVDSMQNITNAMLSFINDKAMQSNEKIESMQRTINIQTTAIYTIQKERDDAKSTIKQLKETDYALRDQYLLNNLGHSLSLVNKLQTRLESCEKQMIEQEKDYNGERNDFVVLNMQLAEKNTKFVIEILQHKARITELKEELMNLKSLQRHRDNEYYRIAAADTVAFKKLQDENECLNNELTNMKVSMKHRDDEYYRIAATDTVAFKELQDENECLNNELTNANNLILQLQRKESITTRSYNISEIIEMHKKDYFQSLMNLNEK